MGCSATSNANERSKLSIMPRRRTATAKALEAREAAGERQRAKRQRTTRAPAVQEGIEAIETEWLAESSWSSTKGHVNRWHLSKNSLSLVSSIVPSVV